MGVDRVKKEFPKIGVVMGSGGLKSFGAIHLYQVLDQLDIPLCYVGGCSGGAFVSACRAVGMEKLHQLLTYTTRMEEILKVDIKRVMALFGRGFSKRYHYAGIVDPNRYLDFLRVIFGDRLIEEVDIPLYIHATNALTGEGCVLEKGLIYKAIYASTSMLPFFPPIEIDGEYYSDGILSRGDPVVHRDVDIIINVQYDDTVEGENMNFLDFFMNFLTRCTQNYSNVQRSLSIDSHHYEVVVIPIRFPERIGLLDYHRFDEIMEVCRVQIDKFIPVILKTIEEFHVLR